MLLMYKYLIAIFAAFIFIISFYNFDSYYEEKEIRLGMSGPFSGSLHILGKEMLLGANVYFKHINEQGGVYGRTFRVIKKDDKYEPKITEENTIELIKKERVFALFNFIGTSTSKVALPVAVENNTPFIGAFSGGQFLRQRPRNPLVLNGRTSYKKEIEKQIEYFVDKKQYRKIAVFYQNDSYGRSGLQGVKDALKKRNMKLTAEGSYKRNTLSVGHALYEIKQNKPEVVIMISATKPTAEFIKRARVDNEIKDMNFGIISFVGSSMLLKILKYKSENIVFSQVLASPWSSASVEVDLYRDLMDKYNPGIDYSYISLEGYFVARTIVELFDRSGENFTKEDFIEQMKILYEEIENGTVLDESKRICKCLNNVYLTNYSDGIFWDVNEED